MKANVRPQSPPNHTPWGDSETEFLEENCSENHSEAFSSPPIKSQRDQAIQSLPRTSLNLSTKFSRHNAPVLSREIEACDSPDCTASASPAANAVRSRSISSRKVPNEGQRAIQQQSLVPGRYEPKSPHCFSFYPIATKKHPNLAVRRGHKAFPCLRLQQIARGRGTDTISCNSIPTAFRGSPTASSLICGQAQYPASQNLSLTEMLENLREKCASFSSRVSLPADWLYRPRPYSKDTANLSDTASDEDEWAFAEPIMDMINSFSAQVDGSDAHPAFFTEDLRDKPILSRGPCNDSNFSPRAILVADNHTEGRLNSPDPPVHSLSPRPSLVDPSSLRTASMKIKKTVRFADSVVLSECSAVHVREEPKEFVSMTTSLPHHRKRQSITLSALIPPSPPLSVVRSLQSATPARNSWADTLRCYTPGSSPPAPSRPLSHRLPTSAKLPLSMDGNLIPRSLNTPLSQKSYACQPALATIGKSSQAILESTPTPTSGKSSLMLKGKKSCVPGENLKISGPFPIGTAVPRFKRIENDLRRENIKGVSPRNNVTTPLRSIFTKFK